MLQTGVEQYNMVKVTDDSCDILLNELMNINEQKHLQFKMLTDLKSLETLPVDDRWTRFVVFLFTDPHLLEG